MTKLKIQVISILTRLRDMRIVWDLMGSLYNRGIYDVVAELYEDIAKDLTMDNKAQILDAGMGPGYLSLLLAYENPDSHVTGVDYSPMQVRRAESYRRRKNISNCSFQRNSVLSLQFEDNTFDATVSVGSIKHWPDPYRGLMELQRVLKPRCRLIIAETDRDASDENIWKVVKSLQIPFVPEGLLFWAVRQVVFRESYSETMLAEVVRRAGFHHIESQRLSNCPYVIVKARR